MASLMFTAVYVRSDDWYAAYIEELPGANTQGRTLEEARENLQDAVALLLEVNREIAQEHTAGQQVIREPIAVPQ